MNLNGVAQRKLMEPSIVNFFLFILFLDYMSSILLLRLCYLFWRKFQHSGKSHSETLLQKLKLITSKQERL